MSYQLNVLLQCASAELATELARQVARDTRPLFEEDVSPDFLPLFRVVELIEFPNEVEANGARVWLSWFDQEHWHFENLRKLLSLEGISLIAAYEVPDYVDDDEGRWFWVLQGDTYRQLTPAVAEQILEQDVVEKLML